MSAFFQKFVNNIVIAMQSFIYINRAVILSVVGFEVAELWFLAHILPGRKAALAYCRKEARAGSPTPNFFRCEFNPVILRNEMTKDLRINAIEILRSQNDKVEMLMTFKNIWTLDKTDAR